MKLSLLITVVNAAITLAENQFPVSEVEKDKLTDPAYREYMLTVAQLKLALEQMKKLTDGEVTEVMMKPIADILRDHRQRVRQSAGCDLVAQSNIGNKLARSVATKLAKALPDTDKASLKWIEYLLSDAKTFNLKSSNSRLGSLGGLSGVVILQDGAVVAFRESFKDARNGIPPVAYIDDAGTPRALTDDEMKLLLRHSNPVKKFLEAKGLDQSKRYDEILDCLQSDYSVNVEMYGQDGVKLLEDRVLADYLRLRTTVVKDHKSFIEYASGEALAKRTKVHVDTHETIKLNVDDLYTGDLDYDRGTLLCVVEQYRRKLIARPADTNSLFAKHSRQEKIRAHDIFVEALLVGLDLDDNSLESFVKAKGKEHNQSWEALKDEGYFKDSELTSIVKVAIALHKKYKSNDNDKNDKATPAATVTKTAQPGSPTAAKLFAASAAATAATAVTSAASAATTSAVVPAATWPPLAARPDSPSMKR